MKRINNILITGGCGFLGQWLTKELLSECPAANIKIIDLKKNPRPVFNFNGNKRVKVVLGKDVCDINSITGEFKGIDVVFHLAGIVAFGIKDKQRLHCVNVNGTRNVLKAALKNNAKLVVHVSSVAAIGYNDDKHALVNEDFEFDWSIARKKRKYYMLTKHLGDVEVKKAMKQGLKCIIVHPGLMYGPGDYANSSRAITAVKKMGATISPPGGTNVVDVRDVAKGLVLAMEKGRPGKNYLLSGYNLTFSEITNTIARKLGKKPGKLTIPRIIHKPLCHAIHAVEVLSPKAPGLTCDQLDSGFKFRYFDNSRARKELGWTPSISFDKTIADTIKWLKLK